jgi:hypothetical protein
MRGSTGGLSDPSAALYMSSTYIVRRPNDTDCESVMLMGSDQRAKAAEPNFCSFQRSAQDGDTSKIRRLTIESIWASYRIGRPKGEMPIVLSGTFFARRCAMSDQDLKPDIRCGVSFYPE